MENQKNKRAEIQDKILNAKTVEEILAIAAEAGDSMTTEEAIKLLKEVEAERAMAMAMANEKEKLQPDNDFYGDELSEDELTNVTGGEDVLVDSVEQCGPYLTSALDMTYREGENVLINFLRREKQCKNWVCRTTGRRAIIVRNQRTVCACCEINSSCGRCFYRKDMGAGYHDYCINRSVRAMHGLY